MLTLPTLGPVKTRFVIWSRAGPTVRHRGSARPDPDVNMIFSFLFKCSEDWTMGAQAKSHAELHLGPADSPCARTTDATVILDDGELLVHVAYLCHGFLEETVSLALEKTHSPRDLLQIPLPGCSTAQVAPFFQLLYSLRADEPADGMSMEHLLMTGLIAENFSFTATRAVVEQAVPGKCIKRQVMLVAANSLTSAISEYNVQSLLGWAESIGSERVGKLCGCYLGMCALNLKGCNNVKLQAFQTAREVIIIGHNDQQRGSSYSVTL